MVTVFDVARWFLLKENMNHKKLQKLCYYAQAWSLVLRDKARLFEGRFEAWAHGPVNRELWDRLKGYGYFELTPDDCPAKELPSDAKIKYVLDGVWDTYGRFTGFQLETITHKEKPWIEARCDTAPYAPSDAFISEDTMYDYYKSQFSGEGIGE